MQRSTIDHKSTETLDRIAPIMRCRESKNCTIFTSLSMRRRRAKRQMRRMIGLMGRAARLAWSTSQNRMMKASNKFHKDLKNRTCIANTFNTTSAVKRTPQIISHTSRKPCTAVYAFGCSNSCSSNDKSKPASIPLAWISMAVVIVLRRMRTAKNDSNHILCTISSNWVQIMRASDRPGVCCLRLELLPEFLSDSKLARRLLQKSRKPGGASRSAFSNCKSSSASASSGSLGVVRVVPVWLVVLDASFKHSPLSLIDPRVWLPPRDADVAEL
mmetsp:Transcript_131240/g.293616  ORF Transcript_131240/g.293616 Transcript_131240/m.293616 type:complete len:272 (-) Transcript_131240:361-1176(-)